MTLTKPHWRPGDPLHERGPWCRELIQFIEQPDSMNVTRDAARWPDPYPEDALDGEDDLNDFISDHRATTAPEEEHR